MKIKEFRDAMRRTYWHRERLVRDPTGKLIVRTLAHGWEYGAGDGTVAVGNFPKSVKLWDGHGETVLAHDGTWLGLLSATNELVKNVEETFGGLTDRRTGDRLHPLRERTANKDMMFDLFMSMLDHGPENPHKALGRLVEYGLYGHGCLKTYHNALEAVMEELRGELERFEDGRYFLERVPTAGTLENYRYRIKDRENDNVVWVLDRSDSSTEHTPENLARWMLTEMKGFHII